jgi:hypothetical protein
VVGGLAEEMVTHRAATYAGHSEGAGAKPAELSSDSRPSFRKMAKALGLTIPQSLLLRADQ